MVGEDFLFGWSWGGVARLRIEVVQAIAHRSQRGLVVSAVNGDRAASVFDRRGVVGQCQDGPSPKQPNQTNLVISG